MARFFSELPLRTGEVELRGGEAHHLIHVRRLQPGDDVELFDGAGNAANARVTSISGELVVLNVLRIVNRPSGHVPILVAVAFPKGERQKWLIEKCVELGVTTLVPLRTARGVALPSGAAVDRWRRQVIAACKQSGRSQFLEIQEPRAVEDFFESVGNERVRLLADLRGALWPSLHEIAAANCSRPESKGIENAYSTPTAFACAIGPEGGWSDQELAKGISAGWRLTRLGDLTLRVETAAIAFVAGFHAAIAARSMALDSAKD